MKKKKEAVDPKTIATAQDASLSEKQTAVKMAMEQIQRTYGKGSIMKLGDDSQRLNIEVVPTGALSLDIALGVGGLPRGRIVEIYGPEASGKTTICLSVIAEAQKLGGVVAFIDAEHALDPIWASVLGVKIDDLLISQPDTGEQALEIAEQLIRSGGIDILVIDSVAALVPRSEIEGEMGDAVVGMQARLMSQALRKLTAVVAKSKTIVIFTNQLRQKIGVMFGNPETTPGGLALKFYASVRLDVRKIETLKEQERIIGTKVRVKVVKNKVAPPFRAAEFDIMSDGISKEGNVIDVGIETEVISKNGAFLKHGDLLIGQGREAAKMYLKENPDLSKKIVSEIRKKIKDQNTRPTTSYSAHNDDSDKGIESE